MNEDIDPARVRPSHADDFIAIRELATRSTALAWTGPDFHDVLRTEPTIGYVLERGQQVVGFLICSRQRKSAAELGLGAWQRGRVLTWLRGLLRREPCVLKLVGLSVQPQDRVAGELMLLTALARGQQRPGDRLEIAVPEDRVAAQVCLRSAGFRALQLLPARDTLPSAILMERQNTKVPPPAPMTPLDSAPPARRASRSDAREGP